MAEIFFKRRSEQHLFFLIGLVIIPHNSIQSIYLHYMNW